MDSDFCVVMLHFNSGCDYCKGFCIELVIFGGLAF